MKRAHLIRYSSLLATLAVFACGDDGGVAADGGMGIGSLDGGASSGTAGDASTTSGADSSSGEGVPSCENGMLDEDESDVDCGGACDPCGPGGQCGTNEDCDTMICSGGFCQTPTCYDGLQNGDEDDIDCGGSCPNACGQVGCEVDGHCKEGEFCLDGECQVSSCENEMQDTLESDVDCGGPDCPNCGPGQNCDSEADCDTQVCGPDGLCASAACDDTTLNGDETDVDCGGSCDVCPNGSSCMDGSDCAQGVCDGGTCVAGSCIDMVLNGDETDVDCGGPDCFSCPDGAGCDVGTDCGSGVCDAGMCLGPLCDDGVENGDESDLDCGGVCGATCTTGQDCNSSNDCVDAVCEFGQCSAPDCSDGALNGDESDLDCGGVCGATCEFGENCNIGGDCEEGVCGPGGTCLAPVCDDGVENGDETDLDCGGICGATCVPGENCVDGNDCTEGACVLGVCQAPTCDDDVQNGIELGIDCAGTCSQPCPVGTEYLVNSTLPDFQVQPAVATPPSGLYMVATWASFPVNDPPQDGDGAGVYLRVYDAAGVLLTGEVLVNATTAGNQAFPAIDAQDTGFVVVWQGPDADGNGIYAQRFNTGGAPLGGQIVVNESPDNEQRRPDVAMGSGGQFVVCWEEQPATVDIVCRQFSAAGVPTGSEQTVNSVTSDNQNLPVVELADSGQFTVVWQSGGDQDGDGVGIFMRRFTAAGVPIDVEEQVNQFNTLDQQGPAIGMNAGGEYVVTWSSDDQDGSNTGIFARRYNAVGVELGNEFGVNTTTAGAQNNPTAAVNADGDFVIAWQTADDGVLTGVFAQRYDDAGNPFNTEFLVNPTVFGLQEEPDVAIRGADEIVSVWSEGDVGFTDRNIRLQRYTAQFP